MGRGSLPVREAVSEALNDVPSRRTALVALAGWAAVPTVTTAQVDGQPPQVVGRATHSETRRWLYKEDNRTVVRVGRCGT